MTLNRSPDYQISLESTDLLVHDKKLNMDFQDGSHGSWPSWISDQNDFYYFCSTSQLDISSDVSIRLAFRFWRKKFK